MFPFLIGFYFLLAGIAVWWFAFPNQREALVLIIRQHIHKRLHDLLTAENRVNLQTALVKSKSQQQLFSSIQHVKEHAPLYVAGALIVLIPSLIAIVLSTHHHLDGFDDTISHTNAQVEALLKGEELAPPSPLPPEVFTTQEVALVRPMLDTASRNWDLLNEEYMQRLLFVFKVMKEKYGYDMAIIEGYRSPERQNLLASMGSSVTNASAYQSYHQYGLAADCAFYRDGKLVISEKDAWAMEGYKRYGEVAESVGLTWGGRWKMMDFGHTELRLKGGIPVLNSTRKETATQ